MDSHGYQLSYTDVDLIFRRFDKNSLGRVSYKDLISELSRWSVTFISLR